VIVYDAIPAGLQKGKVLHRARRERLPEHRPNMDDHSANRDGAIRHDRSHGPRSRVSRREADRAKPPRTPRRSIPLATSTSTSSRRATSGSRAARPSTATPIRPSSSRYSSNTGPSAQTALPSRCTRPQAVLVRDTRQAEFGVAAGCCEYDDAVSLVSSHGEEPASGWQPVAGVGRRRPGWSGLGRATTVTQRIPGIDIVLSSLCVIK
jgi:hypothetical protein